MAVTLFKKALTSSFVPSGYTMIAGDRLTLHFAFDTSGGPSSVEWYPEFATDPIKGPWYREVAEEDTGKGVVLMPKTIRTFADENGSQLSDGSHALSVQLRRQEAFARIQMRITAGACPGFVVTDPNGSQPRAPG